MTADIVDIEAAKAQFSRLLDRVEGGERIVIGRNGRPVATLIPFVPIGPKREFGAMKGEIRILPGFDELDQMIEADFERSIAQSPEP